MLCYKHIHTFIRVSYSSQLLDQRHKLDKKTEFLIFYKKQKARTSNFTSW